MQALFWPVVSCAKVVQRLVKVEEAKFALLNFDTCMVSVLQQLRVSIEKRTEVVLATF